MTATAQSEVLPIRSVLLKHPRQAWLGQDNVRGQWRALRYAEEPDYARAVEEFDGFVALLRRSGPEILLLPEDARTGLDSIYVRDAAVCTQQGLILCRMGKESRRGEPEALEAFARSTGWPVLGAVREPGTLEGGDVVWLDDGTLAVGHGYRTNAEGIRQLRAFAESLVREIIEVPLPHWGGPGDVLHLMSLLSPVDRGKLLVYSRLLPVPFRRRLLEKGYELIEVPEAEYPSMGTNVLAMAPGKCVALAGNPRTHEALARAGVEVLTYEGREISAKGAGGPTCLTRPLGRGA